MGKMVCGVRRFRGTVDGFGMRRLGSPAVARGNAAVFEDRGCPRSQRWVIGWRCRWKPNVMVTSMSWVAVPSEGCDDEVFRGRFCRRERVGQGLIEGVAQRCRWFGLKSVCA